VLSRRALVSFCSAALLIFLAGSRASADSTEITNDSLWRAVADEMLDNSTSCRESGHAGQGDIVQESNRGTTIPPAGPEFLSKIPELRGISLGMQEREFQRLGRSRSFTIVVDRIAEQTNYSISTQSGENVIVMFRNGVCTGIQRLMPTAGATSQGWQNIRIPLLQDSKNISRGISPELQLRLVRVPNVHLDDIGWSIGVFRRPVGVESRNLLYRSQYFHGPYPTDVLAWSSHAKHFPDERLLPVYGFPWEVRIRILNAVTERVGEDFHFTSGELEVGWRKLPRPNPPSE
jgi:hypothetical protein